MGLPFVLEQAGVGVDVAVLRGVLWARGGRTVLGKVAIIVLGPETVEDEAEMLGALSGSWVSLTIFGGPRDVEEVVVEGWASCGFLMDSFGPVR